MIVQMRLKIISIALEITDVTHDEVTTACLAVTIASDDIVIVVVVVIVTISAAYATVRPLLLLRGVCHSCCSCRGLYHLVAATTAAPSIVLGGITVVAGAIAGAGAGKTGGPGGGRPPPTGCKGC